MRLLIGIATNFESRGLLRDADLIEPLIRQAGHEVVRVQYDEPCEKRFELLICLETISRSLIALSELPPWLLTNPEWLTLERIKVVQRSYGKVLCKTREAYRICSELFGDKAVYTGFLSEDRLAANVTRRPKFLHIAGQSRAKNTTAIIDAWRWRYEGEPLNAELTVVADFLIEDLPHGVYLESMLSDDGLKHLQNACQFHLQPSATEGWSHVIHEAMSVNATILTVNAPPMNEANAVYKIPSVGSTALHSVRMHEVSALDIYRAVADMLKYGRNGFSARGMPRQEFLEGNELFKKAFTAQITQTFLTGKWKATPVPRVRSDKPCIAFIGNFEAEHSTENQILWALEQALGYEVVKLQENKVSAKQIYEACSYSQTLIWVRTPGWLQVPDEEMFNLLEWLYREGVKTLSVHLDKFWGIPDREFLIGKIPFWKTQYVFTADGSKQDEFKKRGVNHFWMRPAVSEVYCHPGTPREEYRCDVGFVGAKEYHSEYPFRRQMVEFLEETYGDRFKHVQGVRGHLLNDVYASMKVVVGDCFQAGTPNYWSDRVPETVGRHGLLLHPKVAGLAFTMPQYLPQDLESLRQCIEEVLLATDVQRKNVVSLGVEQIRKHDTWTVRLQEILETITDGKKEHATSAD